MSSAKVVLDVLERLWRGKYVARGTYIEAKSLLDPDGSQEGLETNRLDAASSPEPPAATLHPAVKDAYTKGYQDGVLETLSQLVARFPLVLPVVVSEWASAAA